METVCEFKLNDPLPSELTEDIVEVSAIRVGTNQVGKAVKSMKGRLFSGRGVRSVIEDPNDRNSRLLLLNLGEDQDKMIEDLKEEGVECNPSTAQQLNLRRGLKEIISGLLPEGIASPSGFEVLGSVAMIYLRPAQIPYRFAIGQAILITQPGLKVVANKSEKLSNEYRVPILELIAGVGDFSTEVNEGKVKIKLDPSKVYYCSKLEHERSRVLESVKEGEFIVDACCGVGPFTLRAAKEKKAKVVANDLNPACYEYLSLNIKTNKLDKLVTPSCDDARKMIGRVLEDWAQKKVETPRFFIFLPGLAVDFLDAFGESKVMPPPHKFRIDVYTFQENEETEEKTVKGIKHRIEKNLGKLAPFVAYLGFHFVKNVSNTKAMVCASFLVFPDLESARLERESKKEIISGDGKGVKKDDESIDSNGNEEVLRKRGEPKEN